MHDWQLYAFYLHARQGYAFLNAVKAEFQQAEKPENGRFMLIFWRFYALQDTKAVNLATGSRPFCIRRSTVLKPFDGPWSGGNCLSIRMGQPSAQIPRPRCSLTSVFAYLLRFILY
jgi:hypothetical protein